MDLRHTIKVSNAVIKLENTVHKRQLLTVTLCKSQKHVQEEHLTLKFKKTNF